MELVQGVPLSEALRQPLAPDRVVAILGQLADALDFAHQQGMTHRDVKPANVLIGLDDHVTLIDFGIARAAEGTNLTRSGQVVGTPHYLAPEAITGAGRGPSVDLYALGIVAYEMLTGRVPFAGLDTHAILYAQVNSEPPRPGTLRADLAVGLERVLLRQLAKDPVRRHPTARTFVEAMRDALTPRRSPAPEASEHAQPTHKALTPRRSGDSVKTAGRAGLVFVGLLVLLLVLGVGVGLALFRLIVPIGSSADPTGIAATPGAPLAVSPPTPSELPVEAAKPVLAQPSSALQATPAPNPNPTTASIPRARIINTEGQGANMRRSPSVTAQRVKVLPEGTSVELLGPEEQADGRVWRNVRDAAGSSGYVLVDVLQPTQDTPVASDQQPAATSIQSTSTVASEAPPSGVPTPLPPPSGGSVPTAASGSGTPLGPSAPPTQSSTPNTPIPRATSGGGRGQVGNTSGQGSNIRSEPGGPVLKTLPEGAPLEVLGPERVANGVTWRQVRDSQGVTGWIVAGTVVPPGSLPTPTR